MLRACFLAAITGITLVSQISISAHAVVTGYGSVADALLQRADEIRNPAESYQMQIEVTGDGKSSTFDIYLKGNDKTLIVTREPARDRGRNMLMLDREFNAYVPNLKRSVRLSLSQKLMGQVANGDISRMRWFGDYAGTVEKTDGGEVQLLLEATKKDLTYAKIRLWVEAKTAKPIRAEYLSLNGKSILKRAAFGEYKNIAGQVRPTRITITDERQKTSDIRILTMQAKNLEDSFFTVRNMETFK